jgi:hypothetical protein
MTDETLIIHETAIEDAAFKIACDLADRGMILPIAVDTVTTAVKHRLLHQLHLQRTWIEEDESVTTRQLWSRPVE